MVFILGITVLIAGIIGAESFVLKKKKREPTVSDEDIGQQLGAITEECNNVAGCVNVLQREAIQQLRTLLEQNSKSDKKKLQEYGQLLTRIKDDLCVMQKRTMNNVTDLKKCSILIS